MTVSPDEGWVRVCARHEIGDGDLREVDLGNGVFALLVGAEGRVFACAANCSHQDSPLCEGTLDGRILTCPLHFWQWDIADGSPRGIADLPLAVFEVREVDNGIYVKKR
jgi:toluene monooxygenase system ferredoxin subunit